MEQNNSESLFELQVDHETRSHFKETTKWTNFIAVIYFVCFGLLLLGMLLAGSLLFNTPNVSAGYEGLETPSTDMVVLQMITGLAMVAFLIYGGLMLIRFSSNCRRGVETQDQRSFNAGLKNLRNYFIAVGIIAILSVIDDVINIVKALTI